MGNAIGILTILIAPLAVAVSAVAVLVGIGRMLPTWSRYGRTAAGVSSIVLGLVGFLGAAVGGVGLFTSVLWCASPLIAANVEMETSETGVQWPGPRFFLTGSLLAQSISAFVLGLLLLYWLVSGLVTGVDLQEGANTLYGLLLAQYGSSMVALGACSAVAYRRLHRQWIAERVTASAEHAHPADCGAREVDSS